MVCEFIRCVYCGVFILIAGGLAFTIVGIKSLMDATKDTRGQLLKEWSAEMNSWDSSGESEFAALGLQVTAESSGSTPNVDVLKLEKTDVKPADFGESTWSTSKIKTPSTVSADTFVGKARCPTGGKANTDCTLTVRDKDGNTLGTRKIVPMAQDGPKKVQITSDLCTYYDSDYWHPMASSGMGKCNSAMTSSQFYNYGPSECVDDAFLGANGCPRDEIITQQLYTAGWTWAREPIVVSALNKKPRFSYDGSSGEGKCWDYSDCFCSGRRSNGDTVEFKTDQSKGWGFTGYGYYYGSTWYDFPKPFSQMTSTERAEQCYQQFKRMGYFDVSRSRTNLICFRAGGYPKKPCSRWCSEQGSNAQYTRLPRQYYYGNDYYGPWGPRRGGSGPPWSGPEAVCTYEKTTTNTVKSLDLALSSGNQFLATDGSLWNGPGSTIFNESTGVSGKIPFPSIPSNAEVEIRIRSKNGPIMQGVKITDGCGPVTGTNYPRPDECFGRTQGENAARGIGFLAAGVLMVLVPVVLIYFAAKGAVSCLQGAFGSSKPLPVAQQQPSTMYVAPGMPQPQPQPVMVPPQQAYVPQSVPQQAYVPAQVPVQSVPVAQPIV